MSISKTLLGILLITIQCRVFADDFQSSTNHVATIKHEQQSSSLMFTTEAYKREALKQLIQEANRVAVSLNLPETLPITKTNLLRWYVSPFGMSQFTKAIGNVSTSNYTYYVSLNQQFCFLESTHLDADRKKWLEAYLWPISRLDTNSAYRLATQWLSNASIDVTGLNRDCELHVLPTVIKKQDTNTYFVPLYWIYWTRGESGHGSIASVECFTPTKTLLQLRIEDSKYMFGKPLQFTNLDLLLSEPTRTTK